MKKRPISELELSTARRTLLRRHETDLQSNELRAEILPFQAFKMTFEVLDLSSDSPAAQQSQGPELALPSFFPCEDISCVRDIEMMPSDSDSYKSFQMLADMALRLKALTWRDVQNAYQTLLTDPEQLFVSVCTAGPGSSFVSGGSAPTAVSTKRALSEVMVD